MPSETADDIINKKRYDDRIIAESKLIKPKKKEKAILQEKTQSQKDQEQFDYLKSL